jgi:glycosyltransferase involved in cell wall biosynthesis
MNNKVAIVMPVFNKAPYLKEAIDSILAQTYSDFTLFIQDDASLDESWQIISEINDKRIVKGKNDKNTGTSYIGNLLFEKSKEFEFVIRCDADDLNEPTRFEKLINFMIEHPEIGICSSNLKTFGESDYEIILPNKDEEIKSKLLFTTGVSQPSAIFRMSLINSLSQPIYFNFNSNIGEDWMLFIRSSLHTQFANINLPLVKYRIHSNNISNLNNINLIKDRMISINYLFKTHNFPENLYDAYLLLTGIKSKYDSKNISKELITISENIILAYQKYGYDISFIKKELNTRQIKAVYLIADDFPMKGIKLSLKLENVYSFTLFRYCLKKMIFKK